jgi:xanthine dehydrogenase accessory factor
MGVDVLDLAVELRRTGEAFALATVVRCERPTSAKPGAKALIRGDGAVTGWVGGACAEPVVVREALKALGDGQPRLVALVGEGGAEARRVEGLVPYPMTCHSGGTLEIYVEPFVPKPLLVLVGHGPVLETLAALGRATDFDVRPLSIDAAHEELARLSLGPSASVVVGTHGSGDEEALEQILRGGAGHVSLIASRKRAAAITRTLAQRGVADDRIRRLHAPAGLDIGATTPAEIAVSILAEVIQHRRSDAAAAAVRREEPERDAMREETDPVCGMLVDVGSARYRSVTPQGITYFCCLGCKEAFDREPQRFAASRPGARAERL